MHEFDGDFDCDPETSEPQKAWLILSSNTSMKMGAARYQEDIGWISLEPYENTLYDFARDIWIVKDNSSNWEAVDVATVGTQIVGFGQGLNDELLIFSWGGAIYQVRFAKLGTLKNTAPIFESIGSQSSFC